MKLEDKVSNNCPLCDEHCPLDEPKCHKGEEFARTGISYSAKPKYENESTEKSLEERLLEGLRDCAHFLRHRTEGKGSQRRVLSIINKIGGITQRELMDIVGVRAGSLSELLGKLEGKGLIKRFRNEQDKRNVDIILTESGKASLKQMQGRHDSSVSDLFTNLSGEEKSQLLALLEKLLEYWEDINPEKVSHMHKHGHAHDHRNLQPHGKRPHIDFYHDGRRGHKKRKRG